MSSTQSSIVPGQLLAGKYRVVRVLGAGAMAVVLEAVNVALDQRVAIKVLRDEVRTDEDAARRFLREGRAMAQLRSEHVARVYDLGTDDGRPFLVMELLDGCDLSEELAERGPQAIELAVDWVIQACEGVAEAHARGIVHRDLKPANLFLSRSGAGTTIKVVDFGISKSALTGRVGNVSMDGPATGALMGSPHYMSPEQLRSTRDVDSRADVWSLGVVLFELLSGRMPFPEDLPFPSLVASILTDDPLRLTDARTDVPLELESVIRRALCRDRNARIATVSELAVALLPFASARARLDAEHALSYGARPESSSGSLQPMPVAIANRAPDRERGSRGASFVLGAIALVTGIGVTAFVAHAPRSSQNTTAATSQSAIVSPSVAPPSQSPATVRIAVTPADARVFVDGSPVTNPAVLQLPCCGETHQLHVEADHYISADRTFFAKTDAIDVQLAVDRTLPAQTRSIVPPQKVAVGAASSPPVSVTAPPETIVVPHAKAHTIDESDPYSSR